MNPRGRNKLTDYGRAQGRLHATGQQNEGKDSDDERGCLHVVDVVIGRGRETRRVCISGKRQVSSSASEEGKLSCPLKTEV